MHLFCESGIAKPTSFPHPTGNFNKPLIMNRHRAKNLYIPPHPCADSISPQSCLMAGYPHIQQEETATPVTWKSLLQHFFKKKVFFFCKEKSGRNNKEEVKVLPTRAFG